MAHIIYADEEAPFTGRPIPYSQQNAVRHWSRHYANWKYLQFVKNNSLATTQERRQAEHELVICDKKMHHWQRHSNWDAESAARERQRHDEIWQSARRET